MTNSSRIIPICALKDNYIWLFFDEETRKAWIVDPGDAAPVIKILKHLNLNLAGIFITHHHQDHSGGCLALLSEWPNIWVIGSHKSHLNFINYRVKEGDILQCGTHQFKVIEIPGHTLDHTAFFGENILFSGDTLFSVGCGKVFEGTGEQMYHSLNKLLQLPETTQIFCGHEYTLANLLFAQMVEPHNQSILQKLKKVESLREQNQPTLPSLLSEEKITNPFLRCQEASVRDTAEQYAGKVLRTPVEVFATLREWKNTI